MNIVINTLLFLSAVRRFDRQTDGRNKIAQGCLNPKIKTMFRIFLWIKVNIHNKYNQSNVQERQIDCMFVLWALIESLAVSQSAGRRKLKTNSLISAVFATERID